MVVHHVDLKLFIKKILNLCISIKISVIKRISTYCLYILVTESHDIIKKYICWSICLKLCSVRERINMSVTTSSSMPKEGISSEVVREWSSWDLQACLNLFVACNKWKISMNGKHSGHKLLPTGKLYQKLVYIPWNGSDKTCLKSNCYLVQIVRPYFFRHDDCFILAFE